MAEERVKARNVLQVCQKAIEDRYPGKPPLPTLAGVQLEPYVIEVNFEAIEDEAERACFLNLPTSFKLSSGQVDALIAVAGDLLDRSPRFQKLLSDLKVAPDSEKSTAQMARCTSLPHK